MQTNTDNDPKWDDSVEKLAKRMNKWVWTTRIFLYINGISEYYVQLEDTEKDEFLRILDTVLNDGQEALTKLTWEQFLMIIDAWRRFHKVYGKSMFVFLNSVMKTQEIAEDNRKSLYREVLEATITYQDLFGRQAVNAMEYIVLRVITDNLEVRVVEDDFQCKLVINQFKNYYNYCKRVQELMNTKFKGVVFLAPTGGDFHNNGKTPLFVHCGGKDYVLKPRNMLEEQCINKMVKLFNETMEGLQLPVGQEISRIDAGSNETFAVIEKSVRQKRMDEGAAEAYYKKLGALLFIIKLFGIDDMHLENVMTTADGPVIIDGECLFNYSYIYIKDIRTAALDLLVDGLNEDMNLVGLTNNVHIQLTSDNSAAAVSINQGLTSYGDAVVEGFQNVAAEIRKEEKKEGFTERAYEIYENMVSNQETRIRTVPVKTTEWKALFECEGEKLEVACRDKLTDVKNAIPQLFKDILNNTSENYTWVKDAEITKLMADSIKRGDVPIFYLADVTSGTITQKKISLTLEGEHICEIDLNRVSAGVKTVFENNLNWLLSEEAVRSLEALLTKGSFQPEVG